MKYILLIMTILFAGQSAQAHFTVETQNREIHLLEAQFGYTRVILRFPMTLAYANELAARAPGAEFTGPFMETVSVGGGRFYRIDNEAVFSNYGGFVRFLLRDFEFSSDGIELTPQYLSFAIVDTHNEEASSGPIQSGLFASLTLFDRCVPDFPDHPYISDSMVIMSFHFPTVSLTDPLTIQHNSPPFVAPEGMFFETRVTDHRGGTPKLLTFRGTSFDTVTLAGSATKSFVHFIKQGVHHILIGFDHVLFVLCLVLAAQSLGLLLWSVTGFTIGHSITLAAGVLGYVPQGAWFIPLIELLVAVSILLMGALVLLRRTGKQGFLLAGAIGLLHGFGFSFMLAEMLSGDAMFIPLAGFNIGVELGQLMIVIIAFAILSLLGKYSKSMGNLLRYGVALFACVMAAQMIYQRSILLNEAAKIIQTEIGATST